MKGSLKKFITAGMITHACLLGVSALTSMKCIDNVIPYHSSAMAAEPLPGNALAFKEIENLLRTQREQLQSHLERRKSAISFRNKIIPWIKSVQEQLASASDKASSPMLKYLLDELYNYLDQEGYHSETNSYEVWEWEYLKKTLEHLIKKLEFISTQIKNGNSEVEHAITTVLDLNNIEAKLQQSRTDLASAEKKLDQLQRKHERLLAEARDAQTLIKQEEDLKEEITRLTQERAQLNKFMETLAVAFEPNVRRVHSQVEGIALVRSTNERHTLNSRDLVSSFVVGSLTEHLNAHLGAESGQWEGIPIQVELQARVTSATLFPRGWRFWRANEHKVQVHVAMNSKVPWARRPFSVDLTLSADSKGNISWTEESLGQLSQTLQQLTSAAKDLALEAKFKDLPSIMRMALNRNGGNTDAIESTFVRVQGASASSVQGTPGDDSCEVNLEQGGEVRLDRASK